MAKKKPAKAETKSEFLRKALSRNPNLTYAQICQRWIKSGHTGTISNPLYYQIRAKLGIKTEWVWVRVPEPQAGKNAVETPGGIYQFKITLLESKPSIWRRIQVRDCMLDKLHEHIQTAMGWTNSHLHQFHINGERFGDPALLGNESEDSDYIDSTKTLLSAILPKTGKRFAFKYEYDFGDGWQHEVLFEGSPPVDPQAKYPLCLEGERACPPEDCGGVWGYADFLEAIRDPKHEEHEAMLEWIGGRFDPEKFDVKRATQAMKKGLPDWRRML